MFNITQHIFNKVCRLTHDIAVVANFAQSMNVMYAGYMIESGDIQRIFKAPRHNYTRQLLRSTPSLVDELTEREESPGMPLDMLHMPEGCVFAGRCTEKQTASCTTVRPAMTEFEPGQFIRCHHYAEGGGVNV
jgi:oligopeptide/dipeptide ABC transporter ATP-binding protein